MFYFYSKSVTPMPITEEQHQDIMSLALLRAARALVDKAGPFRTKETRDLAIAADNALEKAIAHAWRDTDGYVE